MSRTILSLIVSLIIGGIIGYKIHAPASPSQSQNQKQQMESPKKTSFPAGSKEEKIENALSAAPAVLAKDATVMDFPQKQGGELVELKKGTNNWTCLPDYPASPGNDPMCVDAQGMKWMQAYITQKEPNLTQAGIGYMLVGGSDASNTDPFATKPTEGNDWITTPSHVMIFPVGKLDQNMYGTDPKKGGSWIMWSGTPYEHLMVPVK